MPDHSPRRAAPMTSEKELRKIAVQVIREYQAYDVGDSFEVPGLTNSENDRVKALIRTWPIPDLPEPDNAYPEWQIGGLSISPGIDPGEVAIVWEGREDTGRGTMPRSRYLTPAQVQAIIAAHYHRKGQE